MAANTVRVSLLADAQKFKAGMRDADQSLDKFGKTSETTGQKLSNFGKVAIAGLVVGAGAALVGFLTDATKAALEDAKAQELLALALKNTVGATDEQVASTEEFIEQTMLASGVADDELRPALAELVRTTGDLDKAQILLGTAMDIAAAKGKPLETVTTAMGKAALGNVGALGRLGVATRNASGDMLTFEEVIAEANRTMGDASEVAANTEAGSMQRLQVRFGELKEEIGSGMLPILVDLGEGLSDVIDWFVALEDSGKPAVESTVGWFQRLDAKLSVFEDTTTRFASVGLPSLSASMDAARHSAAGQAGAMAELEGATEGTAESVRDLAMAEAEAADPAIALINATTRLRDAQAAYDAELAKGNPISAEAQAKALLLAQAQGDLSAASARFAAEGGPASVAALTALLREAGVADASIRALIASMERANNTPFARRDFASGVGGRTYQGGRAGGGRVQRGDVRMVGEFGPETVVFDGPGTVVPNGHGGATINVTVNALDPQSAAKAVVQALQTYNRQNGGIPITTRAP